MWTFIALKRICHKITEILTTSSIWNTCYMYSCLKYMLYVLIWSYPKYMLYVLLSEVHVVCTPIWSTCDMHSYLKYMLYVLLSKVLAICSHIWSTCYTYLLISEVHVICIGCCGSFGRGASLYRHRSQLFRRLWVRLPMPTGQFSEI